MPVAARDTICSISKRPGTPHMDSTTPAKPYPLYCGEDSEKSRAHRLRTFPYSSDTFDLAYSFEVIDEVSDSDRAIHELHRVLKPGGCLLLRLPAFDWLRSSHDTDIGTLHRYTLAEMEEKLKRAGFRVRRSTYANFLLFPVIGVRRFLKHLGIGGGTDTRPMPVGLRWLDPIFRTVLSLEASWIGWNLSLPFGLSAICYAEKAK